MCACVRVLFYKQNFKTGLRMCVVVCVCVCVCVILFPKFHCRLENACGGVCVRVLFINKISLQA